MRELGLGGWSGLWAGALVVLLAFSAAGQEAAAPGSEAAALGSGAARLNGKAAAPLDLGAVEPQRVAGWAEAATISHRVIIEQPQTQTLRVEVTVRDVAGQTLDFLMPAWRPGRYQILDFAGAVSRVGARDAAGNELAVRKTGKGAWRVQTGGAEGRVVTLGYDVYANELSLRSRHVDDTHAYLDGSAIFMLVDGRRDQPQRVELELPAGWQVATGLDPLPGAARTFVAPSYDVLIDCPIEAGQHERRRFEVDGRAHELVVWGDAGERIDRLATDLARLAEAQHAFWQDVPYGRYVWMLHLTSGLRGGTEHVNSTIMQVGVDALRPGRNYRGMLDLASHEFFHTWNVKRLRPAGIQPYDYQRENYTDLLWVCEGTTKYYEELLLVRAGLRTPQQYFASLAERIDKYLRRPGREVQSVAAASYDAWIKFSRPNPDAVNTTVSFYEVGALASLALDMDLRGRTGNRVCLDDILRDMYQQFPSTGPGYAEEDLLLMLQQRSGEDYSDFFARHIRGTEELPLAEYLRVAGLEMERAAPDEQADGADDDADGDVVAAADDDPMADPADRAYLGVTLEPHDGLAAVRQVSADGPAWAAGVQVDDLVVALNGRRLRADELDERLKWLRPREKVTLTLLRRDLLREIELTLASRDERELKLTRTKRPTESQRLVYESWLGRGWPAEAPER